MARRDPNNRPEHWHEVPQWLITVKHGKLVGFCSLLFSFILLQCQDEQGNIQWTPPLRKNIKPPKNPEKWTSFINFDYSQENLDRIWTHTDRIGDYYNINHHYKMSWGARKLLGAAYNGVENYNLQGVVPNPYCYRLLTDFSDTVAKYDKCLIDNQVTPTSICLNCPHFLLEVLAAKFKLEKKLDKPIGKVESCDKMFRDWNKINILPREIERVFGASSIWYKSQCKYCYVEQFIDLGVKEEVKEYMGLRTQLYSCFNDHFQTMSDGTFLQVANRSQCELCRGPLEDLKSMYSATWGMGRKFKNHRTCQDIMDKHNNTLNVWSEEIGCGVIWNSPWEYSPVLASLLLCLLYPIYMFLAWFFCHSRFRVVKAIPPVVLQMDIAPEEFPEETSEEEEEMVQQSQGREEREQQGDEEREHREVQAPEPAAKKSDLTNRKRSASIKIVKRD